MEEQLRIAVIGCAGAGKSTLAHALAAATGLPLIHLDAEHWRPGWVEPEVSAWFERQAALTARERWIIDGLYGSSLDQRLARATLVIWLDLPTRVCVAGVLARWLRWRGRVRPDMGAGCPERMDPAFLRWVLTFRRKVRPRVAYAMAASSAPVVRIASVAQRARFLRALATGGLRAAAGQGVARLASSRMERP